MRTGVMKGVVNVGAVLGVLLSAATASWAESGCRADQKLALIGSVQTGTAVVTSSAAEVRLISYGCTGTACVVGVYDAATLGTTSLANARLEPGAAANTSALLPQSGFFAQPLTFSTGISVVSDGNLRFIAFYTCTDR